MAAKRQDLQKRLHSIIPVVVFVYRTARSNTWYTVDFKIHATKMSYNVVLPEIDSAPRNSLIDILFSWTNSTLGT